MASLAVEHSALDAIPKTRSKYLSFGGDKFAEANRYWVEIEQEYYIEEIHWFLTKVNQCPTVSQQ